LLVAPVIGFQRFSKEKEQKQDPRALLDEKLQTFFVM